MKDKLLERAGTDKYEWTTCFQEAGVPGLGFYIALITLGVVCVTWWVQARKVPK